MREKLGFCFVMLHHLISNVPFPGCSFHYTMAAPGALGIHDLGGQAISKIDTTPKPLAFWECQVLSL